MKKLYVASYDTFFPSSSSFFSFFFFFLHHELILGNDNYTIL